MSDIFCGKESKDVLEYLLKRRSPLAKNGLKEPAPNVDQLETILEAASRVPDHGKVVPFYFLVFEGEAREKGGGIIADAFKKNNPDASDQKIEEERGRFTRAPLVVAVIYRARQAKHPLWEQMMTVGAVCQNLLLACHASGFGAQWLTEWYAYDDHVRSGLGLDGQDVVAGFMFIGTNNEDVKERDRPDLNEIVTHWNGSDDLKKGDVYNRKKFDLPPLGFEIKGEKTNG